MFLVSWRLEPFEPGITVSGLSRSRDHLDDLIGDNYYPGQKLFVVPW